MNIPVLMYHAVSPRITGSPEINPVHIPLQNFTEQMDWLYAQGYETLTIDELLSLKKSKRKTTRKVVLTFDDGYVSLLENVTPVLQRNGFKATLFLTTAAVGCSSYETLTHFEKSYPSWDRPLTWDELKEMQSKGWDIEGHGHEHKVHNMISEEELSGEIGYCKQLITANLNTNNIHYSFPWGRYNSLCLRKLDELGYQSGFSVQPGLVKFSSDNRRLPRIDVNRFVDMDAFQKLVQRGYTDSKQKYKNMLVNVIYKYPRVKDFLKNLSDKIKH